MGRPKWNYFNIVDVGLTCSSPVRPKEVTEGRRSRGVVETREVPGEKVPAL